MTFEDDLKKRTLVVVVSVVILMLVISGFALAHVADSPELEWRLHIMAAKIRGELSEIPLHTLIVWLRPGSPVYLEQLAQNPNPNAAIHNRLTGPEDIEKGHILYEKNCACHGDDAHGHLGPSLIDAVGANSDWSFFSTVKWGVAGTSMQAQPLGDAQVWQVHAYVRNEAFATTAAQPAKPDDEAPSRPAVDVSPERILDAEKNAGEWLTYGGNYLGHHHTLLSQITKKTIPQLRLAWVAQLRHIDRELEVSPVVADGVMYVTEAREGVIALDARTGEVIWTYRRPVPDRLPLCCSAPNRGVAILGHTVFVATIDAYLVALDANTGRQRWITRVADYRDGYSLTAAPLALGDRVILGVAGGEFGIRGFLAAFDASDGRMLWKFHTVPGPGEFGNDTWSGDSWKTGGAPTWNIGAYDPQQNLVFWGTGNPGPPFQADVRRGDNLFSNSVVAVDATSGRLAWHYQFTPRDEHDWDSAQPPILADILWQGRQRAAVLWVNRNGFFYALDRKTGEFLFARPFVKQTWNEGFDSNGRPMVSRTARPSASGSLVWPGRATNWWPASYDSSRQLVFASVADTAGVYFQSENARFVKGEHFFSSMDSHSRNHPGAAYIKAIDAQTGDIRWQTLLDSGTDNFIWTVGGVLSTGTGLVFAGYSDIFRCFDADNGKELWRVNLGGRVHSPPISFAMDGRQYVAVAAGHSVFTFRLP
jgi:alcohol dehydrogenase (cytochrome c)